MQVSIRGELPSVQIRFLLFENITKLLKIHIKSKQKCLISLWDIIVSIVFCTLSKFFLMLHSLFSPKHGNLPARAFSDKFCCTKQKFLYVRPLPSAILSSSWFCLFSINAFVFSHLLYACIHRHFPLY